MNDPRSFVLSSVLAAAMLAQGALAQQPAATPASPASDHAAANAKPAIYDEKASGAGLIETALAAAKKNNRRVLVQWGANWCPWCHLLHESMGKNTELKKELLYEYDVVLIDVGHMDRNMDLAAKYGADLAKSGIPYLTVLDASGKVITNQETGALESKEAGKKEHDVHAVLKFLKDHQASPRVAADVLKAGLSQAASQDKRVFLHFGAPWCGWCHRLEAWMARPDVAAILDKAFIDVKIDVERDTGGPTVLESVGGDPNGGIPWFVFLDSRSKTLAASEGPKGNIGFPSADDEIAHFVSMLKSAGTKLTAAEIETLAATLKEKSPKGH